jgi:hypothetical protein
VHLSLLHEGIFAELGGLVGMLIGLNWTELILDSEINT